MVKTIVPIGPYHPLQEEPEFFTLTVEGEKVVDIDVQIGYNHRGIEKLSEMKTFDQSTYVIERICGICSSSHPYAYIRYLGINIAKDANSSLKTAIVSPRLNLPCWQQGRLLILAKSFHPRKAGLLLQRIYPL